MSPSSESDRSARETEELARFIRLRCLSGLTDDGSDRAIQYRQELLEFSLRRIGESDESALEVESASAPR